MVILKKDNGRRILTLIELPAVNRGKTKVFTLIELLVVVGIIIILISILLPALKNARESSWKVICKNNLKQLGVSFIAYSNDHGEYLPQGGSGTRYPYYIGPYLGTDKILEDGQNSPDTLRCPYNYKVQNQANHPSWQIRTMPNYIYNWYVLYRGFAGHIRDWYRVFEFNSKFSRTVVLTEGCGVQLATGNTGNMWNQGKGFFVYGTDYRFKEDFLINNNSDRIYNPSHRYRLNILFLDSHVDDFRAVPKDFPYDLRD